MKNTFFSGLLFLCLLFAGCGGKKQSLATEIVATNMLDSINTAATAIKLDADTVQQVAEVEEIPEILQNNKEAREYFESMNKVVDDYEKTVDNIELEKMNIKDEKGNNENSKNENSKEFENADNKDEKDKKKPNRLQRIAIHLAKFKQKTADFMNKISSLRKKESKLSKGMNKKESEAFAKMCVKLVNKISKAKRRR